MRKLWLTFAQTATVALAVLFVLTTLKPEWLPQRAQGPQVVELTQSTQATLAATRAGSYSDAVRRAAPAVVSIFTRMSRSRSIRSSTILCSGDSSATGGAKNRSALRAWAPGSS